MEIKSLFANVQTVAGVMMIQRTFDYRIVNRLAHGWIPVISRQCIYLLEKDKEDVKGLWSFEKFRDGVRIHADMGLKCRGKQAIESAKRAFAWIFKNLSVNVIYAGIPMENKPACQIAVRSGMMHMDSETGDSCRWFQINRD